MRGSVQPMVSVSLGTRTLRTEQRASLLGAIKLLVAPGHTTRSKDATSGINSDSQKWSCSNSTINECDF